MLGAPWGVGRLHGAFYMGMEGDPVREPREHKQLKRLPLYDLGFFLFFLTFLGGPLFSVALTALELVLV